MKKRFNSKVPSDLPDQAVNVIRPSNEPEDIDLAAEATNEATPAKALAPRGSPTKRATSGPGIPVDRTKKR